MRTELSGRVALVTGASRGIGRACALALAREGCDIVVAAKTTEPDPRLPGTIFDVAREVEAIGRRALPAKCDVRDEAQIAETVRLAIERLGRIDILINNAGALWWRPVEDTPAKRFDLVMDVNVRAAFLFSRACLRPMLERGWGHIINMSPPIELSALPNKVAYLISKYGMTMLTMGLAEELKGAAVAVNSLWPATVVESQATINFGLGDRSVWRKADILADAVVAIVSKNPSVLTGKALIDEDVLRAEGVTDFEKYNCVPGAEPMRLAWDVISGK